MKTPSVETQRRLRALPAVSALLECAEVQDWLRGVSRGIVVTALRRALDDFRETILHGQGSDEVNVQVLLDRAEEHLFHHALPSLRRVINATGIVLHTGLGRAPLSEAATEAMLEAAAGYCNLEYDLTTGQRGKRLAHVADLLRSVTTAEGATVLNNNAAATLLILQTFAAGREVIVSRGQLIEIGGSFRLPDVMRASGAVLREVGTTNRTRLADYESSVTDATAIVLRVHPSNFRVTGFVEEVPIEPLVELAHRFGLLAVDDLGSGALFDLTTLGLPAEPHARRSLAAGADLICFSGDKLLGGPQCGIVLGRQALIDQLERNPLMRTYRVDKLTLAALEATLRSYLDPREAAEQVPSLSMLCADTETLAARAQSLCEQLSAALPHERFFVCSDEGFAGGGALPVEPFPTVVVQWRPSAAPVHTVVDALRHADVPIIARVRDDAICFDLRTIRPDEIETLVGSVQSAAVDE